MNSTSKRRCMLAAVGLCLCLAPAVAELADVYLKSGMKLRGDVTVTATEVIISNAVGEVRYPREDVERVVPVEQQRPGPPAVSATQPAGEAEPGTPAAERPELPAPPVLSALDIQRLKMSELRLDGRAEKVRVRFASKAEQRDIPRQILREARLRPDFQPEWEDILLRGQPHEKLQVIVAATGTEYAGRVVITSDPEVFATFRTKVLPVIARGCARSGCHAGSEAAAFRFPDGSPHNEAYAYTTFLLLDRMETRDGPLIDRDDPRGSVLLSYMLPVRDNVRAHPSVTGRRRFTPTLRSPDNVAYERVVDWINCLRVPHMSYALDYEFPAPAGPVEPAAPEGAAQPPDQPDQPATQPADKQPAQP